MTTRFARSRWKRLVLLLGVLLCLASIFIVVRRPNPPPFVVLARPYSTPPLMRDRLLCWVPATPSWAWVPRLENAVLGRRKTVNISADVVVLPNSARAAVSGLLQGATTYSDTSGLRLSYLRAEELRLLRKRMTQTPGVSFVSRPRISTADGIAAALFVGETIPLNGSTNQVGLSLNCYPRVRGNSTDLFAAIISSEAVTNQITPSGGALAAPNVSIRTNLDMAARIRIPKGCGVILLQTGAHPAGDRSFAALIDPL